LPYGKQNPSFCFIFGPFVSIFDEKQGLNQRKSHPLFRRVFSLTLAGK